MRPTWVIIVALALGGCAVMQTGRPTISDLVDLDPTSVERTVIVGNTAYIANFDTRRGDDIDADGRTALHGIGAPIAQIAP